MRERGPAAVTATISGRTRRAPGVWRALGRAALAAATLAGAPALAQIPPGAGEPSSQEGYYYPPVTSSERFTRSLIAGSAGDRSVRIGFVTEVTKAMLAAPDSPAFVIFAKGSEAQHMIIVATGDEVFRTLWRARAVLAQLTANIRSTAFFQRNGLGDEATWLDLARMLGFRDLVISDGATWSHRITFD